MAWINLVAERAEQRRLLKRDSFLDEGYEDLSEIAPVLLMAALADEPALMAANAEAAADLVARSFDALTTGKMRITSWHRFGEILTTAILMGACGHDTVHVLHWAQKAPLPRDQHAADLHRTLSVALGLTLPGCGWQGRGHADETLAAWPNIVATATPSQLAQLALCPDHAAWRVLSHYAAVSALASVGGVDAGADALTAMLAWAGRKGGGSGLLYERQTPRIAYDSDRGATDPAFAQGIDAIVTQGERTVCYYNMALRFLAPWICDNELDAFWFLRWTDQDWQVVLSQASDQTELKVARSRPIQYIITVDPANAKTYPSHTARASERYGLDIEMRCFLEC